MEMHQMQSGLTVAQYSRNLLNSAVPDERGRTGTGGPRPCGVIMHIALQGCLKSGSIPYGLTADTGGHIRYLLELVDALSERPEITHQIIVTRAFDAPHLGEEYNRPEESLSKNVTLWRCRGESSAYLPKEALWKELPHMTEALMRKMQQQGIQPDLIHAHYADAGAMAMRLKAALGIPYVFTAHSLGAPKAEHRPANSAIVKGLKRRIRYEELAIKHAYKLIASSEHEAHVQYGMYKNHDASKIQINPPGSDLQSFRLAAPAAIARRVDVELKRFLRKPDRPCLLAIARPVEKKNLCALVRAYGENPQLRDKANLVIYAGTRRELNSSEPEARRVWQELLQLVDDYDLYGKVAYPKQHELGDVPAIYQWAAQRRGVFVNPALYEPFGLTLLEAAASGLPVVATQEGGPIDILSRCQHGLLVPPTDIQRIAEACHHFLADDLEWKRHSSHGHRNVDFYTWSRHASQYILDIKFPEHVHPLGQDIRPVTQLLATDMDGTLLGHRDGLISLGTWLAQNRQCLFVVATGRSVKDALRELKAWSAPLPDFLIADVGSSIYQIDRHGRPHLLSSWHRRLNSDWRRAECQWLLGRHSSLEPQPEYTQSTYKLSYFTSNSELNQFGLSDGAGCEKASVPALDDTIAMQVERALESAGLAARVVHSHGNLLDILPLGSGKAQAVDFLRQRFNVDHQEVVAAGDSGNDIDLLQSAALGIAVANHLSELKSLRNCSNLYWAQAECAGGILEGLEYRNHTKCRGSKTPTSSRDSVQAQSTTVKETATPPEPSSENGTKEIETGT